MVANLWRPPIQKRRKQKRRLNFWHTFPAASAKQGVKAGHRSCCPTGSTTRSRDSFTIAFTRNSGQAGRSSSKSFHVLWKGEIQLSSRCERKQPSSPKASFPEKFST